MVSHESVLDLKHFTPGMDCLEQVDLSLSEQSTNSRFFPFPYWRLWTWLCPSLKKAGKNRPLGAALIKCRGNVTQAAVQLGISRQLLHYKMKKYQFTRTQFSSSPE